MAPHFLSFADRRYRGSLARIAAEAGAMGRFASVEARDERSLGADYWRVHAETVRRHRRGYGLFTWKPHVLAARLAELPAGDLLVYADAGCSLNPEGAARLDEYLALAAGHPTGVLAFALAGRVGEWTKRAALAAAGADDEATRRLPMVLAGILVLRSDSSVAELLAEWARRMADVRLVDDSPSPGGEHSGFRAHRHDQSIFTLLAHGRGLQSIPDETWWDGQWDARRQFPIHARRWRHRLPWSQAWMRRGRWPRV